MIGMGGLALLIGASVYAAAWIAFAFVGRDPSSPMFWPINLLVIAGSIGIAAGLPGIQALQERQAGAFAMAATGMLVVGFLHAGVARQSVEAFTLQNMERVSVRVQIPAVSVGVRAGCASP